MLCSLEVRLSFPCEAAVPMTKRESCFILFDSDALLDSVGM